MSEPKKNPLRLAFCIEIFASEWTKGTIDRHKGKVEYELEIK